MTVKWNLIRDGITWGWNEKGWSETLKWHVARETKLKQWQCMNRN